MAEFLFYSMQWRLSTKDTCPLSSDAIFGASLTQIIHYKYALTQEITKKETLYNTLRRSHVIHSDRASKLKWLIIVVYICGRSFKHVVGIVSSHQWHLRVPRRGLHTRSCSTSLIQLCSVDRRKSTMIWNRSSGDTNQPS